MSDFPIERREIVRGLRVTTEWDQSGDGAGDPRDADNLGTVLTYHRDYNIGDYRDSMHSVVEAALDRANWRVVARWLKAFHGASVVLPIHAYIHSGITISTGSFSDPWDSGFLGLIFDTPESRTMLWGAEVPSVEAVTEALEAEVTYLDAYLQGNVLDFTVEKPVLWRSDDGDVRVTWEHVESCGGFLCATTADEQSVWDEAVMAAGVSLLKVPAEALAEALQD